MNLDRKHMSIIINLDREHVQPCLCMLHCSADEPLGLYDDCNDVDAHLNQVHSDEDEDQLIFRHITSVSPPVASTKMITLMILMIFNMSTVMKMRHITSVSPPVASTRPLSYFTRVSRLAT